MTAPGSRSGTQGKVPRIRSLYFGQKRGNNDDKRRCTMSSLCRWLGCATAAIAFCTTVSGQPTPSILGVVHKVEGSPVSHVEVRIEGAGATQTSDSGEFAFPLT